MKKVYLHFKDYVLGFLVQENNSYVWFPDTNNIKSCFYKYNGAVDLFLLEIDKQKIYNIVPQHFSDYLVTSERTDIVKNAKIESSDSDFEKLYKMASLKYFGNDFYISQ